MSTTYRKLFSFNIKHRYYSDGVGLADFNIRPTMETLKVLKDHGMRFLSGPMGNHILYRVEYNDVTSNYDPFISTSEMAADLKLRFTLELKNAYFFNITKLVPTKPLRASLFYYAASTGIFSGTLASEDAVLEFADPVELDYRKPAFTHDFTLTGNPAIGHLQVLDAAGAIVQTYQPAINSENKYKAHIELSRLRPGKYALQKINAGTPEGAPEEFYFDPNINPSATFGMIELSKSSLWKDVHDFNAIAGNNDSIALEIGFKVRKVEWVYNVVFKKTALPTDLVAEPVTIEENWVKITGNRYHNSKSQDEMFFVQDGSPTLLDGYDSLKFKTVQSAIDFNDRKYPIYQETKRNLNLKIDGETAYGGIPNPDYKNLKNEVIIYV